MIGLVHAGTHGTTLVKLSCNFGLSHVLSNFLYSLIEVEEIDERWAVPGLPAPSPYDSFRSSLRLLLQNIRTLKMHIIAD